MSNHKKSMDRDANEPELLERFRQGSISHFELSQLLKLDRFETDAWLKKRNVYEGSLTMADLEQNRETLLQLIGEAR